MTPAVWLIAIERQEQIEKHGYTLEDDQNYTSGQLLLAARYCETLDHTDWPVGWNLTRRDKIALKPYKERLIIAGAFIAAEIDRLNNLKP